MKTSNRLILSTFPQSQPAKNPSRTASLALRQRSLYGRAQRYNTGKELDSETGLYYYGARYLDPRASRWLSGDPAMGEYVPVAPVNEEARKRNGNLPGMGGVFNYANLHAYHYAGNNPVKLVDPDGNSDLDYFNLGVAEYFDNQIQRALSLPGIALANFINSAKNFVANIFNNKGSLAVQFSARIANSKINISMTVSDNGVGVGINSGVLSQLEAISKSPVRTTHDSNGNLTGLEFHIPVYDRQGIMAVSAVLGANFDTKTGDATAVIGGKLSGPKGGWTEGSSIQMRLLFKASTIGEHPTIQGGDFIDNFEDAASRERFNEVWANQY